MHIYTKKPKGRRDCTMDNKCQVLQCDRDATGMFHAVQLPTCCRRDRGGGRPSPGCCPALCCDRGSGPSAAPPLASAGSAAAEGAASQRAAGKLQGHRGGGGMINLICAAVPCTPAPWPPSLQGCCENTSAHFVVCPAVCCGRRCPCPPTLPWPSDPQHGCTSSTCGRCERQELRRCS